jgi:hypothetical protein
MSSSLGGWCWSVGSVGMDGGLKRGCGRGTRDVGVFVVVVDRILVRRLGRLEGVCIHRLLRLSVRHRHLGEREWL